MSRPDGTPVEDGARVVQFKIYDAPISGQAIWNGEVHKLSVNRGMVHTILGSKASLDVLDFNHDLYLEMTLDVDGDGRISPADPPLLPRQVILPAVYAVEAASAQGIVDDEGKAQNWSSVFVNETGVPVNQPRTGFLPGARLLPESIAGEALADGAVTAGKIRDDAVEARHLGSGAVSIESLAPELSSMVLEPGSIGGERLEDGAVSIDKRRFPEIAEQVDRGGIAFRTAPAVENLRGSEGERLIPDSEIRLTTTGGPVLVQCFPAVHGEGNGTAVINVPRNESNVNLFVRLYRRRGAEPEVLVGESYFGFRDRGPGNSEGSRFLRIPLSAFSFFDVQAPAGLNIYVLKVSVSKGTASQINSFVIMARELR